MAHCFQGPLSSAQGKKKKNPLLLGVLAPTTLNLQFSEMAEQMYIFQSRETEIKLEKKKAKPQKNKTNKEKTLKK